LREEKTKLEKKDAELEETSNTNMNQQINNGIIQAEQIDKLKSESKQI